MIHCLVIKFTKQANSKRRPVIYKPAINPCFQTNSTVSILGQYQAEIEPTSISSIEYVIFTV